jgi:phosphatidylserine decarboxylase
VHAWLGFLWALPVWLIALFVIQFFRDPPRTAPANPNAVLCPADGRIVVVERARDPYLDRDALKFSVFMNVFNAHSNRSPVDGEVLKTWYHPGTFLNAALAKSSLENERAALWIRTPQGADVTVVQVAGLIARRILCHAKAGQHLSRGARFGFIRFGSRVDVYLPLQAVPKTSVGDKVYATSSALAELS